MINNFKIETKMGLRYYSGGQSSGSGNSKSNAVSSSVGSSASHSAPQMTPGQLVSLYQTSLPSILSTASQAATANSPGAPAQAAANKGAVAGVNAINMNGLSPGEANAVERSTNQGNLLTGNLGNSNATNTISNAMNFGGAFNNKIPLMNASTNAAANAANAGTGLLTGATSVFNPIASDASSQVSNSSSLLNSGSTSGSTGSSQNAAYNVGCFLTTAACVHKGLPDDCAELDTLRKFRDDYVPKELVKEYYNIAPAIVNKIKNRPKVLDYVWETITNCVGHINRGDNEGALLNYKIMVNYLKSL